MKPLVTYYKFVCENCAYTDTFTDIEQAEEWFLHTQAGVMCGECSYLRYPKIDRSLTEADASETWEEEYYDECYHDELRHEKL